MTNNISFKGLYKVSSKNNNFNKMMQFSKFGATDEEGNNLKRSYHLTVRSDDSHTFDTIYITHVPDSYDRDLENYCISKGIKFEKKFLEKDINKTNLENHFKFSKKGFKTVYVNAKKLEELAKNQHSNIDGCKSDYGTHTNKMDFILKSDEKLPLTTLYVVPVQKDHLEELKECNIDNLAENELHVNFYQGVGTPEHCTYFLLQNMGLENIPVFVNDITYELGNTLGLFKDETETEQ